MTSNHTIQGLQNTTNPPGVDKAALKNHPQLMHCPILLYCIHSIFKNRPSYVFLYAQEPNVELFCTTLQIGREL